MAGVLAATLLAGCSALQSSDNLFGFITPYRVEVVQGNVLTQEQVALVKPGRVLFEISGVDEKVAREAFELAATKLPMTTKFLARSDF